jgi:hypothetical protein
MINIIFKKNKKFLRFVFVIVLIDKQEIFRAFMMNGLFKFF